MQRIGGGAVIGIRRLTAALGVGGMLLALSSASAAASSAKSCGEIAFTQGTTLSSSNYGVGNVKATNVTCSVALKVAGAVKDNGALSYSSNGFKCKGLANQPGAGARRDYRCTRTTKATKHKKAKKATVTFFSIGV